jgi:predicted deacetylase
LTPVECLERLYRPFLERGLPVNLATIPEVSLKATMGNGQQEGFLLKGKSTPIAAVCPEPGGQYSAGAWKREPVSKADGAGQGTWQAADDCVPLAANRELLDYLHGEPGFHIVQHGCHHDFLEFDQASSADAVRRLERGREKLLEAGFDAPQTFVAPYDKLSRAALAEVARRFRVLSTGWYELRRLPYRWWPGYAAKKLWRRSHWRIGQTMLLTHPGCLLSYQHTYSTMLGAIFHNLQTEQLTVLVTHWWEYFRDGRPDEPFIDFLHETADYLATHPHLKVISFEDLATGKYPLN